MRLYIIILCCHLLGKSLAIRIGHVRQCIYAPAISTSSPLRSSLSSNNCQECLCQWFSSMNQPSSLVNCSPSSRQCVFYKSSEGNYTCQWDPSAQLYFLPAPIYSTTTISPPIGAMIGSTTRAPIPLPAVDGAESCSLPKSDYLASFYGTPSNYSFYWFSIQATLTGFAQLKFLFQGNTEAEWHLDDVSLRTVNPWETEMIDDGGFEKDSSLWTPGCSQGCISGSSGRMSNDACRSDPRCFIDGCTGAFDSLSQTIWLTTDVTYNLSFWLYLTPTGTPLARAFVVLS